MSDLVAYAVCGIVTPLIAYGAASAPRQFMLPASMLLTGAVVPIAHVVAERGGFPLR